MNKDFLIHLTRGMLFLLLLGFSSYLIFENLSLKKNLSETTQKLDRVSNKLDETQYNLSLLKTELYQKNYEIAGLTEQLNVTSSNLDRTKLRLNDTVFSLTKTRNEFLQLRSEIFEIEKSINSSIQWFKNNSQLPISLDYFSTKSLSACIDEQNIINLGCIAYLMNKDLGITYLSEESDRLYSLEETILRKSGDCEDFSLFLKAFINSLPKDRELNLGAWVSGEGRYKIYSEGERYWYYPGQGVNLGKNSEVNPFVICYATKYDSDTLEGHCIVALSSSKINNVSEISSLNRAATFEPQNGMYMGIIGGDFYLCQNGNKYCDRQINAISFVISDNDLYQFTNNSWKSYQLYREGVSTMRRNIDSSLTLN